MNTSNPKTGILSQDRNWVFLAGVALIAISSAVVVSCFHDDDPDAPPSSDGTTTPVEPPPINVTGTSLFCDTGPPLTSTVDAASYVPEQADNPPDADISKDPLNHNAGNNLKRLTTVVVAEDPAGDPVLDPVTNAEYDVRPLIVSYGEQVIGIYEGGDGSADIGDPDNIDDIFTSLSLDNGKTWKKIKVGDTADKHSTMVAWAGSNIDYPGHSHKPTMQVWGNNILVAWNDKYCPSGDPFDLFVDGTTELRDPEQPDTYKVNGAQGSIDYGGIVAPNGKLLYEVPFSCVWTARGVFDADDAADGDGILEIQWRQAQQLTSGTRDSNKIWIASEEVGFAITWQEDTEGLRSGKGLGPGEGYSGATTNHGTDIWYTYISLDEFDDVCSAVDLDGNCTATTDIPSEIEALAEKPKPAVNFAYPVRITNNETCGPADFETKPWCETNCTSTVFVESGNQQGDNERCVQDDIDYMTPYESDPPVLAVLDGDTGASRPALKLLKTNADVDPPEVVVILAYEETKGLSESDPADQGDTDINIALEGKAIYFESFLWKDPVTGEQNPPTVSAGRVVNLRVPEVVIADDGSYTETGEMIYENARRVVIMPQVDECEMVEGDPTFALMYKQGYDTQGGPSDMFVRVNYGFTYDPVDNVGGFGLLDGREVTNISAHENDDPDNGTLGVIWNDEYLDHQSYEQPFDNTFSPRGWLRGAEVYNGFEFSPRWKATSTGTVPNNFWIHRFVDGAWQGPMQLSIVTGPQVSTLDPRFIPTEKARPAGVAAGLESDRSNPDVIFLGYGTFDMTTGEELDLFYTRSTDKGVTWEYIDANGDLVNTTIFGDDGTPLTADDPARLAKLSAEDGVHEMELQGLATPDGTKLFGAWLRETPEVCGSPECGMDSRVGVVNYVDPATLP